MMVDLVVRRMIFALEFAALSTPPPVACLPLHYFDFQACLLTNKGIGLFSLEYFLVSHRSASGTYAGWQAQAGAF